MTAVTIAIVALAVRRFLGRNWAITLYGVALWTTVLAIPQAGYDQADVGLYAQIGVSLPVALLLVIAALATIAALWENIPAAMIAPAAIAWLALFGRIGAIPALAVALAIFAVGAALYQFRGRGWDIPWLVAGALGSFGPLSKLRFSDPGGPYWQVGALLIFGRRSTCSRCSAVPQLPTARRWSHWPRSMAHWPRSPSRARMATFPSSSTPA